MHFDLSPCEGFVLTFAIVYNLRVLDVRNSYRMGTCGLEVRLSP